jgi:hypothetical protein
LTKKVVGGTGILSAPLTLHNPSLLRTQRAGRRRGGCGGDSRAGAVELEFLQLGGHEDLVRAAPGEISAGKGLGVEPIELLVVVERVVVEEKKAPCLCEPSEGEHVAEAGVPPADVTRVLVVGVLAVVNEERCAVRAREGRADWRLSEEQWLVAMIKLEQQIYRELKWRLRVGADGELLVAVVGRR